MAKKGGRTPLNAFLNGRLVGQLRRATSGAIDFQYDRSWLDWEHTFPASISLPLREDRYIGDPVIAVFDNLLPDNKDIRARVAERTQADGVDAYSLLAAIGRDCVGALQFLPDGDEPGNMGELEATPISDKGIADTLSNLANSPLGVGKSKEFRISFAGAQDKTAFLRWKGKWHIPHGTTATTHIFKPQIGQRGTYDLTTASRTSTCASRFSAHSGSQSPILKSRTSPGQGRSSSNALIVNGPRTVDYCVCRKRIVARHFRCRQPESIKATSGPA